MRLHEEATLSKIHHQDRALLTGLTAKTLFCRSCFQPIREDKYHEELTTPFMALLDVMSAMLLFVALMPMMTVLPFLIVYEVFVEWINDDNDED